jgi:hypothetical protein
MEGMRRRLPAIVLTAATVVAAVVVVHQITRPSVPERCTIAAPAAPYELDFEQTANAATIAAVATAKGLPDHAVTVALATALQESKLHNVGYGDRDSLGLFQQRPSQGWGAPSEIMQPRYAAAVFYDKLVQVPGWSALPVSEAAQYVQHSAAGSAYAAWEPEARAIARALTGEVPAGVACGFPGRPSTRGPEVSSLVTSAFGSSALGVTLPLKRGWAVAAYVVAQARDHGVAAVSFAGQEWSSRTGTWRRIADQRPVVLVR